MLSIFPETGEYTFLSEGIIPTPFPNVPDENASSLIFESSITSPSIGEKTLVLLSEDDLLFFI